jgi:hypothetical protein
MGYSTRAGLALTFQTRTKIVLGRWAVQGKPVVRRGRKARDLESDSRPPGRRTDDAISITRCNVKANLARFTTAIALLASVALSLGAGIRWECW